MKHLLITLLFFTGFLHQSQAQLTVADDNKVGIGVTEPVSKLAVNAAGNSYSTLYVENNTTTSSQRAAQFYKGASGDNGGDYSLAVLGNIAHNGGHKLVGGQFQAYTSHSHQTNYKTFGVRAVAGNGFNGMNYGLFGYLYGNRNGAAIYGCTNGIEKILSDRYAGYFQGDVYVLGNLHATGTVTWDSDINLKKNIRPLSSEGDKLLEKLKTLTAIKYYRKNPAELNLFDPSVIDTMKIDPRTIEYTDEIYTKERIGLSAQEVQAVFPELVREDNDGFLSLDYVGLIPVLIEGLKEQDEIIEQQEVAIEQFDEALKLQTVSLQQQNETLQGQEEVLLLHEESILELNEIVQTQAAKIEVLIADIEKLKNPGKTE